MTDTSCESVKVIIDQLLTPAVVKTPGYCDIDLPVDPLRDRAARTLQALSNAYAQALAENARLREALQRYG